MNRKAIEGGGECYSCGETTEELLTTGQGNEVCDTCVEHAMETGERH